MDTSGEAAFSGVWAEVWLTLTAESTSVYVSAPEGPEWEDRIDRMN